MNNGPITRLTSITVPLLILLAVALACAPTDAGKPTISIAAPPNGARITVGQTVEVRFTAEDARAVAWVQMTVDDAVVATQESPLEEGQTPLEGILRWTPAEAGTFKLVLTARSVSGQDSDPAAVSIEVIQAAADVPMPTPVDTPRSQAPRPTATPTATTRPAQPAATATTQPGNPTATTRPTKQPTTQATPTATATNTPPQAPTHTPTKTPIPSETQVPSPEIVDLSADLYTVDSSQCTTIRWETRNANDVRLNQESVWASGDRTYCWADLGSELNTFELQASNGIETAMTYVTITKVEPVELNAPFVPGSSGSVGSMGQLGSAVSPGDDGNDVDYDGFVTFDIGSLPGNASIQSAYMNLGTCTANGDPAGLGNLDVLNLQYGELDVGDYAAGGAYIASIDPCTIFSIDVTDQVQARVQDLFFQVRLSFPGSDFDGSIDDVTYSSPTLDITYILP